MLLMLLLKLLESSSVEVAMATSPHFSSSVVRASAPPSGPSSDSRHNREFISGFTPKASS